MHGGEIRMKEQSKKTSTWRGHTHRVDIHTEGPTQGWDMQKEGRTHGETYTWRRYTKLNK